MSETKEEIAAQRDQLLAENEQLKSQLASVGAGTAAGRAAVPQHVFQLSEGDRQELEFRGVVNIGGRLMTKAQVEEAMAKAGQRGVTIADAPDGTRDDRLIAAAEAEADRGGILGLDYIPTTANADLV